MGRQAAKDRARKAGKVSGSKRKTSEYKEAVLIEFVSRLDSGELDKWGAKSKFDNNMADMIRASLVAAGAQDDDVSVKTIAEWREGWQRIVNRE